LTYGLTIGCVANKRKKNDFPDEKQRLSCKNRRFGGTHPLHLQGKRISELGATVADISN
jgi:hypothetical protein